MRSNGVVQALHLELVNITTGIHPRVSFFCIPEQMYLVTCVLDRLTHSVPCCTVPPIFVAGDFKDIPQPGHIGADNVGLVTLPGRDYPVAEVKALFVSANLLKQV